MREEGLSPNVVTYNTLVDVYGKRGAWEQAVGVLDDMTAEVGGGVGVVMMQFGCSLLGAVCWERGTERGTREPACSMLGAGGWRAGRHGSRGGRVCGAAGKGPMACCWETMAVWG
jgi:pentatricopeptide repeat protein